MSWRDRLRPGLNAISPDGDVFNCKWIGDNKTKEKNVGIYNFPDYNGSVIQDLGRKGISYPLTIYFDGEDNDIEAQRFFTSCDQIGPWEITHPVDGKLDLQMISITLKIIPVESGNITECQTRWIEITPDSQDVSLPQVAGEINQQALETNETTSEEFANNITQETAGQEIATEQTTNNAALITETNSAEIISQDDDIASKFGSTKRSIADTLNQSTVDALVLAGQIQSLVQLPALATSNVESRFDMYESMSNDYYNLLSDGFTLEDKNNASVVQLYLSSLIVATCQSAISGKLETRTQAIELSERLNSILSSSVENLDNVQSNFENNDIDMQYFSNSLSYNDLLIISSKTILYLLESSLSLKKEKRFILQVPKTPLQITIEEYGNLGIDDSNLDFFINTNKLKANDIRLLYPGHEVVVYV